MKVLIACEESQTVCKAFRALGHEAYSCDIVECSGGHPEWHVMGDARECLSGGTIVTVDGKCHTIVKWDLLIAHPPCTYLSNAGARHLHCRDGSLNQARLEKAKEAKDLFMAFWEAEVPRVCVENPVPTKIHGLPPYTQIVQPYMFGHPVTKKTCLWLRNLPPLTATDMVTPDKGRLMITANGVRRSCWTMDAKGDRQRIRSKTFEGLARAMAEQWGG